MKRMMKYTIAPAAAIATAVAFGTGAMAAGQSPEEIQEKRPVEKLQAPEERNTPNPQLGATPDDEAWEQGRPVDRLESAEERNTPSKPSAGRAESEQTVPGLESAEERNTPNGKNVFPTE